MVGISADAVWCGVQVIWVDLLTKEEFTAGFGSHTPIFTGQTKCVRYYMNFERALALQREVLAEVTPHSLSPCESMSISNHIRGSPHHVGTDVLTYFLEAGRFQCHEQMSFVLDSHMLT